MNRRHFLGTLTVPAFSQDDTTFRSDVKVVSLLANVLDKQGRLIHHLTKDDFQLLENGRPQTLKYFSRDTDLPLTLGLLIDTSMSQARVMEAQRTASFRFLDSVLRPRDMAFIMRFDMDIATPAPLTAERESLRKALAFVDTPTRAELRRQSGGGTLLLDAIVTASKETMLKQQGRKALIVISDGGENGSDATLAETLDTAHRADTLIYSILFGGSLGVGLLRRLAKETGGGYFEPNKKTGIDEVFSTIQEELRGQYNLGYVSDVPVRVSEFRTLQLTTAKKGFTVQARGRYWAQR